VVVVVVAVAVVAVAVAVVVVVVVVDYAVPRCLSVCPFVTRQYSVETARYNPIFFTIGQLHHSIVFIARQHTDARY